MKLLAIDTAQAACSAAVFDGPALLAARLEEMRRGQSERLIPMVEEVLASAGLAPEELQAVAVTVGPGAFTGIRIGLAAARGFGVALDIPVVGITTTAAVAAALPDAADGPLAVVLETKRDDVYLELFDAGGESRHGPAALPVAEAVALCKALAEDGTLRLAGDGAGAFAEALHAEGIDPLLSAGSGMADARVVGRLGLARLQAEPAENFARPPAPLYLRPPDVSKPKPGRGARGG